MADDLGTSKSQATAWNAGGWFGAQVGGTCWIAICAALLSAHNTAIAGSVFALFVGANVVGLLLWRYRSHISAYTGLQALIAVIGAVSLAAVFVVDRADLWQLVEGVGGTVTARQMYILIATLIVALLGLIWFLNRSRSNGRTDGLA